MKVAILILAMISPMLLIGALSFGFMVSAGKATPHSHMDLALLGVGISIFTNMLSILYILKR